MKKPNILFLISHDTGRYLGCYGRPVKSPEIDQLASNGVRFDQSFCPAPQCSPSRGSVLTGLYPHNNGLVGLAHYEFGIGESISTLPMELEKGGYETSLIGFSHETMGHTERGTYSSTTKLGYSRYEKVEGSRAPQVADKVIEFLQEKSNDPSGQPFFANIGFWETHRTFDEYEPFADEIAEVTVPEYLPDTENVRKDIALMNGSVKVLDQAIGRVLKALKDTGLEENTILIYTTDHGIAFPRAKGTMKEAGLETALIFYSPKLFGKSIVTNELICNVDLMPTILELADLPIPSDLDGTSFASLLLKGDSSGRDEFFCELTWHDNYHPMRGIRTKKYKYVKNFEDGPEIYMPMDIHKSLSGSEVRTKFYVPNAPEELYDLETDPLEETNLIDHLAYEKIAEELRRKVAIWMEETKDPLLEGPVPGVASTSWAEEARLGRAYAGRK